MTAQAATGGRAHPRASLSRTPLRPRNMERARAAAQAAGIRDRAAGALALDTQGISRTNDAPGSDDALLRLQWTGTQGDERKRMVAALRQAGDDTLAQRLLDCSSSFTTYARADGRARVNPHRCDHAVCPRCVGHRTRATRRRYEAHATKVQAAGGRVRFITLTQPVREGETWRESRTRLLRQWARWWRRKDTRSKVAGCLRRVETTWSTRCKGWHVHIHLAFEGKFWHHADLVTSWSESGDGISVRINEAYDSAELFKYLLKTAKAPADRLVEYAHETKGVRNLEFLGCWRHDVEGEEPEGARPDDRPLPYFQVSAGVIKEAAAMTPDDARWRLTIYTSSIRSQLIEDADRLEELAATRSGVAQIGLMAEAARTRARGEDPDLDLAAWARAVWAARQAAIELREEWEHERVQGEIRRKEERARRRRAKQPSVDNRRPPL